MNAKGDANRSVRLTKQRLYQALITLLQQKSLREITVRELTEMAGISRGTFYFHYADIYALMDQMEATQLARLNDLMDTLIPSISQEDAPPALVALFTYMTENPELCAALYGKSWESEFTHNAKKLVAERCLGGFTTDGGQRLLRHDCGLAGGRVPAAAGRDCTHHVAGHPCRKRAHLSERFCADHLAFCAQTEYNKNITNYSPHGNFEGENCNGIF